jgi:hypothetical protein
VDKPVLAVVDLAKEKAIELVQRRGRYVYDE